MRVKMKEWCWLFDPRKRGRKGFAAWKKVTASEYHLQKYFTEMP